VLTKHNISVASAELLVSCFWSQKRSKRLQLVFAIPAMTASVETSKLVLTTHYDVSVTSRLAKIFNQQPYFSCVLDA